MISYSEAMFRKALGTVFFALALAVFHWAGTPTEILGTAAAWAAGDVIWYYLTRDNYPVDRRTDH